jgi:hypothetical protein
VDIATGFLAKRPAMGIESDLKLIRDQLESRSDYWRTWSSPPCGCQPRAAVVLFSFHSDR